MRAHEQWSRFEEDVDDVIPLAVRQIRTTTTSPDTQSDSDSQSDSEKEGILEVPAHGESRKILVDSLKDGLPEECWLPIYNAAEVRRMQEDNAVTGQLLRWLEQSHLPSQHELFLAGEAVKHFWLSRDRHFYLEKTLSQLNTSYMWYRMQQDCLLYVRTCSTCSKNKKPNRKPRAALGRFHAGAPLERVHLDILDPFIPSSSGNQYVLVLVDQFTKWVEFFPLPIKMLNWAPGL